MTVPFLRTPDERFADVPDFPDEARYVDVGGRAVIAGQLDWRAARAARNDCTAKNT